MKIKTLATAVALTLLPAAGFAYECNYGKNKQASMSCIDGNVFDATTGTCVPATG
ncbi:MAG: carbohydrate-binding module family 14 protein [Roseobacter sp.]